MASEGFAQRGELRATNARSLAEQRLHRLPSCSVMARLAYAGVRLLIVVADRAPAHCGHQFCFAVWGQSILLSPRTESRSRQVLTTPTRGAAATRTTRSAATLPIITHADHALNGVLS
jgi:hypothetical protein